MTGSPKGVDCEISYRLERETKHSYNKSVETSPNRRGLKTVRLTAIRNGLKQIIFTSGELELLQFSTQIIDHA